MLSGKRYDHQGTMLFKRRIRVRKWVSKEAFERTLTATGKERLHREKRISSGEGLNFCRKKKLFQEALLKRRNYYYLYDRGVCLQ